MCWQVFDNVTLDIAADDADVVVAFNLEVLQRGHKVPLAQTCQKVVERNVDRDRVGTTTVNHTRYKSITACLAGGPLACPRAYRGF